MVTVETFKIPKFDPEHGISNMNSVQESVKDTLFKWSKYDWDTKSRSRQEELEDEFSNYIEGVLISTDSIVASAASVLRYYYPNHIRQCTFKDKIGKFFNLVEEELLSRDEKNKSKRATVEKLRENPKLRSTNYTEPKSNTAKYVVPSKPKAEEPSIVEDGFPSFESEHFPSAESDLFSKMLATK